MTKQKKVAIDTNVLYQFANMKGANNPEIDMPKLMSYLNSARLTGKLVITQLLMEVFSHYRNDIVSLWQISGFLFSGAYVYANPAAGSPFDLRIEEIKEVMDKLEDCALEDDSINIGKGIVKNFSDVVCKRKIASEAKAMSNDIRLLLSAFVHPYIFLVSGFPVKVYKAIQKDENYNIPPENEKLYKLLCEATLQIMGFLRNTELEEAYCKDLENSLTTAYASGDEHDTAKVLYTVLATTIIKHLLTVLSNFLLAGGELTDEIDKRVKNEIVELESTDNIFNFVSTRLKDLLLVKIDPKENIIIRHFFEIIETIAASRGYNKLQIEHTRDKFMKSLRDSKKMEKNDIEDNMFLATYNDDVFVLTFEKSMQEIIKRVDMDNYNFIRSFYLNP